MWHETVVLLFEEYFCRRWPMMSIQGVASVREGAPSRWLLSFTGRRPAAAGGWARAKKGGTSAQHSVWLLLVGIIASSLTCSDD